MQHALPFSKDRNAINPDDALGVAHYHRKLAQRSSEGGAMPAETYQYDIAYDAFENDYAFKAHWKVVGCERHNPNDSTSEEGASIRVVMDLPPTQRLYPTAYTPGFPTVPLGVELRDPVEPQRISGLPPGYSVALDVHILEDARMMLVHQRSFRDGEIDPKYIWLEAVVKSIDDKGKGVVNPRAKTKSSRTPKVNADVRPAIGDLPLDCSEPGRCDDLQTYSDMYGHRKQVMKHVGLGQNQVFCENGIVNAFGDSARLPPRVEGTFGGRVSRQSADQGRDEREGRDLDAAARKLGLDI